MTISVRVDGAERVQRKFETLSTMTKSEMKAAGRSMLDTLQANMPDYPPPPIGSDYVRTLNLFDALRSTKGDHPMSLSEVRAMGGDVTVVVGVSGYGPLVVGTEQAWMHKGRWWKLVGYVREMTPALKNTLTRKVSEWIGSAGFGI